MRHIAFAATLAALTWLAGSPAAAERPDLVLNDFEASTYGDWKTTGDAFGGGPAEGTLPNQMPVSGYDGQRLVNSYRGGDASTGTLTSPPFEIRREHINFLIGGGDHETTAMNLLVDGEVVRSASGPPGGSETLTWRSWAVADFDGETARIQIVDRHRGGWGHINVDQIVQSDVERNAGDVKTSPLYDETYRPQFHFTAEKNWLNDPNGLVHYQGEYHLFFQHNPEGIRWGNMTWAHAVSDDLLHWRQLDHAILPDKLGTVFSGSAVVDKNNTSGFGQDGIAPLVCAFTYAGEFARPQRPFTQGLAYSLDGREFTKFENNPILEEIEAGNRDPKVFWHSPSEQWVMALYVKRGEMHIFNSPDLKRWQLASVCGFPGAHECPELFELPVDDDPARTKWVLWEAGGRHLIGQFDGETFTPESDVLPSEWGNNCYAGQLWNNEPKGRRVFIGWMRGGVYPLMPFNQQMTLPRRFKLQTTPDGIRLHQQPIEELQSLVRATDSRSDVTLEPGENALAGFDDELYDVELKLEASPESCIALGCHGHQVTYDASERTLSAFGKTAPLPPSDGPLDLRIVVDRTSMELFAQDGRIVMSFAFVPDTTDFGLSLVAVSGGATAASWEIRELKSVWTSVKAGGE